MLHRTAAARSIWRAVSTSNAPIVRARLPTSLIKAQLPTSSRFSAFARPTTLAVAARKPVTTALVRYASGKTGSAADADEVDMMAGIRSDVKVIKDTFSLRSVPKEALYLGLAGVVPYLATSSGTVYLAWEMNNSITTGSGYILSGETAELLMRILEPVQIGYGAVILSFLGAIHWGMEWAGYGGKVGYRRYAAGVVAPAVAWPTLFMPTEYALISQFLAFTFLYYSDARSSVKGWTPPWYSIYRFVLTFVVGASIVLSLVGREQLALHYDSKQGLAEKIRAVRAQRAKDLAATAAEAADAATEESE